MSRLGLANASIADIIAESGLSAGAIYSHFSSKDDLARYIAESLLATQIELFEAQLATVDYVDPPDLLRMFLSTFDDSEFPRDVLIQYWAAATTEPELRSIVRERADTIAAMFAAAVVPWVAVVESSPRARKALAARTGRTMLVVLQGYLLNTTLFGPLSLDEYVQTTGRAFAADPQSPR